MVMQYSNAMQLSQSGRNSEQIGFRWRQNAGCESIIRMWAGSEFQAAGPATVNKLSVNRVLVRCTRKLPRADRSRLSVQPLHR